METTTGRGSRWPLYAIAVVVAVAAAVSGVLIAASHPPRHEHRQGPVFVIVFASAVAVVVAAIMVWSLRRQLNRPAMKRLLGFSFSQRRTVMRSVNRGTSLTDNQQTIAHAQLEQLNSVSTRLRWLMPLAAIAFIVPAVTDAGGLRWLWTAMTAFELVSLCAVLLVFRRQKDLLQVALDRADRPGG